MGVGPGLLRGAAVGVGPRLETVTIEYHYLRTGRVARTVFIPADAAETLAWARTAAGRMAQALATPDDPGAFPPRSSTACATCPWVNRCPAGQAALEAMDETHRSPTTRKLGSLQDLLLTGEARIGRLRERLKLYLRDREPLASDGIEFGFFPTKGQYEAEAVVRVLTAAGMDPWPLLAADGRALSALFKREPEVKRCLASAWSATRPWFGHRKRSREGTTLQRTPVTPGVEQD